MKWKNHSLYDPWTDLKDLQKEINNLFNVDRLHGSTGLFDRNVSPAMDVIENENSFVVFCELPGLVQADIDLTITSNVQTVKGEKNQMRKRVPEGFTKKKPGAVHSRESYRFHLQSILPL